MLLGKGRYRAGLNRVSLSFRNFKEIKVRRRAGAAPQATRGKPSVVILWDMPIHTNKEITVNRPDIVIKDKKGNKCTSLTCLCHLNAMLQIKK